MRVTVVWVLRWLGFYRKYGIVELFDNKLDGVYVSVATE